ncbi:MAG: DUF2079 domain-containing protein [Nitrospinota bacterium]
MSQRLWLTERRTLLVGLCAWLLAYLTFRVIQHLTFGTHAWDLSIFDYGLANTLRGRFFYIPWLPHSYFGEHFAPILLFILPFYFLHDGPLTLVVLQVLVVGAAAIPLFAYARSELRTRWAPVAIAFAYLLCRPLSRGLMFDFHMEMMEPLFLFTAFAGLSRRRWSLYWTGIVLAFMTKEDVPIYLFVFGLWMAVVLKEKRVGLATAGLSFLWAVLALQVVMPAFSHAKELSGIHYMGRWGQWGETPVEALVGVLTDPGGVFEKVWTYRKARSLFNLFGPFLFLPLLAPSTLLLVVLPIGVNLLSTIDVQSRIGMYYATPVLPYLFLGTVRVLRKLELRRGPGRGVLALAALVFLVGVANSSFWDLVRPRRLSITQVHRAGWAIAASIPPDASVSAMNHVFPHVQRRDWIYVFPDIRDAEYILLDTRGNPPQPDKKKLADLRSDPAFELLREERGFLLLKWRGGGVI